MWLVKIGGGETIHAEGIVKDLAGPAEVIYKEQRGA